MAECLEDCTVFKNGHLELLNELTREMAVWEKDEKARFGAALMWDHPDSIETVMDVAKNLDRYILDDRIEKLGSSRASGAGKARNTDRQENRAVSGP
ncbi:MAG: hypothetical protein ACLTW9_29975 [Enterocloster sp.]